MMYDPHDQAAEDDLDDLPMTTGDWLLTILAMALAITVSILIGIIVVKLVANAAAAQIQAEDMLQ